jgi:hypothetical protein
MDLETKPLRERLAMTDSARPGVFINLWDSLSASADLLGFRAHEDVCRARFLTNGAASKASFSTVPLVGLPLEGRPFVAAQDLTEQVA